MTNRSLRPLALLSATLRRLPAGRGWLGACEGQARSASYCYGVWLRHLKLVHAHAPMRTPPRSVAELGPGPSLGTLLAALLCGAEQAVALDVTRHATSAELNRRHASQLAGLLQQRASIPIADERGDSIRPQLDSYSFPTDIPWLTAAAAAVGQRASLIESMLEGRLDGLRYVAPWADAGVIEPATVDLIVSQAVMEHVDDLAGTYAACHRWLRPGGLMSHQIDFRCHGTARHWNGHYTLSKGVWQYLAHPRPYLLNRQPPSKHLQLIQASGFEIVTALRTNEPSTIDIDDLAPEFGGLSSEDLHTSGMYVIARRLA